MVAHAFNSRTQEAEASRSLLSLRTACSTKRAPGQLWLLQQRNPDSKTTNEWVNHNKHKIGVWNSVLAKKMSNCWEIMYRFAKFSVLWAHEFSAFNSHEVAAWKLSSSRLFSVLKCLCSAVCLLGCLCVTVPSWVIDCEEIFPDGCQVLGNENY